MDLKQCGRIGLHLSAIGIGTLIRGYDTDDPEALNTLRRSVDAGGNLVECSASHGGGVVADIPSEAIPAVGRHHAAVAWRGDMHWASEDAWVSAVGRSDLLRSLGDALARLDADYVDVRMVGPHPEVPLEETLEATTAAYRLGRARYMGLSRAAQRQLAEAVTHGVFRVSTPISVVEFPFSLADTSRATRVVELNEHGVGVIAASASVGGALTGKYRYPTPIGSYAAPPHLCHLVEGHLAGSARGIIGAAIRADAGLEHPTGDVVLVWVYDYSDVTSALVGPHTLYQLETLLDYAESLSASTRQVLSEMA